METEAVVSAPKYTKEEDIYRSKVIRRIEAAKLQRDSKHTEFDDMDYLTRYETNAKAANAYVPPKTNKIDTRIVTGTTREKEHTLLSALLNYNLEPNVEAFDKDDLLIAEIGETMEGLIKKSRELEMYDDKRPLIYKEGLDQGDAFVEEAWIERSTVEKALKASDIDFGNLKTVRWDKKLKSVYGQCEARLKSGTQVLLGNVKIFDEWEQPCIATVDIVPYADAEMIYGKFERWDNVPKKIVRSMSEDNVLYRDWSLTELNEDMCEVIKYYDPFANETMFFVNGVMMLPVGFPLTAISPSGKPPIAKLSIEPISYFFAYSNSIPSKTKVEQAVMDEMIKSIVTVFQQKVKPPMANNTGRSLSPRIFDPGSIHNKIDPKLLTPILQGQGLTPAEFSVFELVKKIVDEKTTNPTFSGDNPGGDPTATQVIEQKKQAMMKLGFVIWGVLRFERRLAWLRLYNIIEHWTKPISTEVDEMKQDIKDVYRTVTVKTSIEDGRDGRKIIAMNPEMANQATEEGVMAEEEFLSSSSGIPTRKIYLNPKELRTLKANWFITVTPTEKDTSSLDRVLYMQNLGQAAQVFGPQSLNLPYHKKRFAILSKEDPDQYFLPDNASQVQPMVAGAPSTTALQGQMKPQQPQQPSLNTLLQK